LLARRDLDFRSRIALGLLSAAQLPLVVAIAEIGAWSRRLKEETAASLVGAGMASVLLFPIAALALRRMALLRQHTRNRKSQCPRNSLTRMGQLHCLMCAEPRLST
jgi:hypothetical protein